MAVNRTYTYLGKIESEQAQVPRHLVQGEYTALSGDGYSQAARPTLTFSQISNISKVVGLYMGNATSGWQPAVVSVSGNILTVKLFEGSGAGETLTEKPTENYGAAASICATVAGI